MSQVALILGDMLFEKLPGLLRSTPIVMVEDWELCTRIRHHSQKIVLFLSAMRHAARAWRAAGRDVRYFYLEPGRASMQRHLQQVCQESGATSLVTYEPADCFFQLHLQEWSQTMGLELILLPNPMFLTTQQAWKEYREQNKRLLMADFYRLQRKRLGILVEGTSAQPVGGKWSYDSENRKPLPRTLVPPKVWRPPPSTITQGVIDLVRDLFDHHPGDAREFGYPVTHEEAHFWLDQFLTERVARFGDYEDALSVREETLYHSQLSPCLNTGLLTPDEVVTKALAFARREPVPLNSLEGFLRQVIGWREFIRGVDRVYAAKGYADKVPNALGHTNRLAGCWWDATTGLPPLDLVIRRACDRGWCHHIERLMVVGSAMLLCEVHPEHAYQWFMEHFVDSADWVMRPNVYGMSQFADGGLFATKPYISGSTYLRKMGDFPAGPWCEVWDGLYWRFIDRHRSLFQMNPRVSVIPKALDRMELGRRERIFLAAESFLQRAVTAN